MHKRVWIKKATSFKEAEEFEDDYYKRESVEERLGDIQFCRQMYFLMKGIDINAARKGLRRVFRIIQQK